MLVARAYLFQALEYESVAEVEEDELVVVVAVVEVVEEDVLAVAEEGVLV